MREHQRRTTTQAGARRPPGGPVASAGTMDTQTAAHACQRRKARLAACGTMPGSTARRTNGEGALAHIFAGMAWKHNYDCRVGTGCLQQCGAPPEHVEGHVGVAESRIIVLKRRERDTNHLGLTVSLLVGVPRSRRRLLDSASHDGSHAGLNDLAAAAAQACRLGYGREAREEEEEDQHEPAHREMA